MESADENSRIKKRKARWSYEAEELLLILWAQYVIKLSQTHKKFYIFAKMSNKMEEMGYPLTAFEISVKIHNLKSRYKEELKGVVDGYQSQWPMYESVHKIMQMYGDAKHPQTNTENNGTLSDDSRTSQKQMQNEYDADDDQNHTIDDDSSYLESYYNAEDTATSSQMQQKSQNQSNEIDYYLKSINTNLSLFVEKINDLAKQTEVLRRERYESLKKIVDIFKNNNDSENIRSCQSKINKYSEKTQEKNKQVLQNDDDPDINIKNDIQDKRKTNINDAHCTEEGNLKSLMETKSVLDEKLNENLKTNQLKRDYMTQTHELQMKILNTELAAKRMKTSKK